MSHLVIMQYLHLNTVYGLLFPTTNTSSNKSNLITEVWVAYLSNYFWSFGCVGQRLTSGVLPQPSPSYFSYENLNLQFLLYLLATEFPGSTSLQATSLACSITDAHCCTSFYTGVKDLNSGPHVCTESTFYPLSHFPQPSRFHFNRFIYIILTLIHDNY